MNKKYLSEVIFHFQLTNCLSTPSNTGMNPIAILIPFATLPAFPGKFSIAGTLATVSTTVLTTLFQALPTNLPTGYIILSLI